MRGPSLAAGCGSFMGRRMGNISSNGYDGVVVTIVIERSSDTALL
jgi:hypothetical protein